MSRHGKSTSYGHRIVRIGPGAYRIQWTTDRYVAGSRQRFPTGQHRDTDTDGAERFAKRWSITMPASAEMDT